MYNEYRTQLMQGLQKIHKILDSVEFQEQLGGALNVLDSFTSICEHHTNQLYNIHKRHPFNKVLKREFEMYHSAANKSINDLCEHAKSIMAEFKEMENEDIVVSGFSGMMHQDNESEIE